MLLKHIYKQKLAYVFHTSKFTKLKNHDLLRTLHRAQISCDVYSTNSVNFNCVFSTNLQVWTRLALTETVTYQLAIHIDHQNVKMYNVVNIHISYWMINYQTTLSLSIFMGNKIHFTLYVIIMIVSIKAA